MDIETLYNMTKAAAQGANQALRDAGDNPVVTYRGRREELMKLRAGS